MARSRVRAMIGVAAAAVISTAARRAQALSPGGAVAATLVGSAVVAGSGMHGGSALAAFFLSSTMLGHLPGAPESEQRRGNERDATQVIANGGVAAILALASSVAPERVRSLVIAGFGGAIAVAAADTWATEIGSRSFQQTRLITTLAPVEPGTSGGVTLAGLGAAAAGAVLIAAVTTADFGLRPKHALVQALPVALGGFAGSLADSVLGATVQEVRFCDRCVLESEQHVHRCGVRTRPIRGVPWCNNDTVNAVATGVGAITAAIIAFAGRYASWSIPSRTRRGSD